MNFNKIIIAAALTVSSIGLVEAAPLKAAPAVAAATLQLPPPPPRPPLPRFRRHNTRHHYRTRR
ncbi:hypothetical protein, partial [Mucilaginibacter polytrichastri]